MKRFAFFAALALGAMAAQAQNYDAALDSIALDSIMSIVELQEIVVKGQLPNTRLKGNAMVTKVTGSVLEKAGTAADVLRKVPGMIKKGEELEVIGRGTPIYYINGRRVRDTDELKRLMSDEIADVEVITNPGAMYDASVSAVVRIKTVRRQGDGLSFSTFAKTEQSLRTGKNDPEAQINVNYRTGGWDFFASVKEWEYRTNQWGDLGQITTNAATTEELFKYEGNMKYSWRGIGTHLTGGLNWQINDCHSLGAKVDYAVTTSGDTYERLYMDKWDRGTHVESVNSEGKKWSENPDNVLVNAYYNGNVGKLNIDFNADMFFSKNNEYQDMDETASTTDRKVRAVSTSDNDMIATKLVLSYPIWQGQLQAGTEETFVKRNACNEITGTQLPNSKSHVNDNVYAGFLQYGFALDQNTHFSLGLRFEHAYFDYIDKPQHQLNLFAVASHTWGCYSPSWTVAMVKQWLTLDFDNGSRSFNKPMWVFNASNAFRLPHNWQLELNSEFHSKANYTNVELVNNYWSLETAVQKSFLKNNALTLRLAWQDMARKGNESVYIYYGSYSIHQSNVMDYNRVIFTLRYSFNAARSKYKGTGAGKDARNRIGSSAK